MARISLFFWLAGAKKKQASDIRRRLASGRITNDEREKEENNGSHKIFLKTRSKAVPNVIQHSAERCLAKLSKLC